MDASTEANDLSEYDDAQREMMEERCILLDWEDRPIGSASKKECHLIPADGGAVPLHRAFSVFLFSTDGRLMLQKRSADKITFPSYWANTCCSHPLFDLPGESDGAEGVIIAARRKLQQELGIVPESVPKSSFFYLQRVHYASPCDDKWGEHEIDYILICRPPVNVKVAPNPNEVAETRYFSKDELKEWMSANVSGGEGCQKVSPWFRIIHDQFLYQWWDNLENLDSVADRVNIFRGEGTGN